MTKIAGSKSISQRNESADPDPDPQPKCHGSETLLSTNSAYYTWCLSPLSMAVLMFICSMELTAPYMDLSLAMGNHPKFTLLLVLPLNL